jgi:hypothetical protein
MNRVCALLAGSALLFGASTVHADLSPETRQACHRGYDQGQRLRRAGQLLDARKELLVCARDPCPAAFQPECVTWLAEVERVLPSVVIEVRQDGVLLAEARVSIDGHMLTERLDGREIPADPGEHRFRVEVPGQPALERSELLVEGDKAHRLLFDVASRVSGPLAKAPVRVTPWVPAVVTVVGALALGSFAYFGATGLARRDDVLNKCQQHCNQSDIDFVRQRFTIADVSLGVSVAALGVATYLWIRWAGSDAARTGMGERPLLWVF